LNHTGRVGSKTRDNILSVARQLRYQPNLAAQVLKSKTHRVLGLVLNAPLSLQGAGNYQRYLSEFISFCSRCNIRYQIELEDFTNENERIPELLTNGMTGGVVYGGGINQATRQWLVEHPKAHFVGLDNGAAYAISTDFTPAMTQAVYCLAAHGHKRVGLITGPLNHPVHSHLRESFIAITADLQLDTDDGKWIKEIPMGDSLLKSTVGTMDRMEKFFNEKQLPTVIICSGIQIARACINTAERHGIRVPEQLSIISGGAEFEADMSCPPISLITCDYLHTIEFACRNIMDMLAGNKHSLESRTVDGVFINKSTIGRNIEA
jgi:LacI family transcriptional regulator